MTSFGKTLKNARTAKKCTLRKLADNIDRSISYLSDIEHDRKQPPNLEIVSKMEGFLEVNDGTLVNLANQIRKSINVEWGNASKLSRKLKTDQRFATIMHRVKSLTDDKKDKLIKFLERNQF